MKKFLLPSIVLALTISSISVQSQSLDKKSAPSKDQILIPKIFLVYPENGTPLDRECAALLQKPVQQLWIDEAANRLEEFQALWDKEGTVYMRTALEEIGVPFLYREMQATLTVCDLSSMSSPLLIYVRNFLPSSEKPQPLWAFAEIVFHEVMHTYVRDVYDISPLRKKYDSEPPVVLNHVHLMALEKLVLEKLQKKEMLEWIDNRYRNRFPPMYKRAWEIVNDIEGHEAFINELKLMPSRSSGTNTSK